MSDLLVHRGPDSAGEHVEGGVGLAARRLSIIDLEHGDQPIANEDGSCVVVQNGEIYNYPELRRELERAGHVLRTHCDTEALVHLYEEHGVGFAERLRGMFAVAIWDARRRRLVLARDPYGIKPLYYRHVGGARRSRGTGDAGTGAHVHDRLRRAQLRRARRRTAGRRAIRDRAPRAARAAGAGAAAAGACRGVRRAVRRLVRAPDLSRLPAG